MKRALQLVCLLALCNLTLLAQTGQSPRAVHTTEKSAIHVPPQEAAVALKNIYSNLGSSKTDLYNDNDSWLEAGPDSAYSTQFIAMAFTPKSNSHVSQVRVAVQHDETSGGANQVNLSIYGDTNGAPGTLLAGPVTVKNLPGTGTCCLLAVANFPPVAVTGGSQYWVVADTPLSGTGSDFAGAWDFISKEVWYGVSTGSGWLPFPGIWEPAGEVLGTIP